MSPVNWSLPVNWSFPVNWPLPSQLVPSSHLVPSQSTGPLQPVQLPFIPTSLLTFLPLYSHSPHPIYIYFLTYLLTYLLICSPCSPYNTNIIKFIITIICQFYCFSIASTELCELVTSDMGAHEANNTFEGSKMSF